MDLTIAVVPRERFTPLPDSLRSLFSTITPQVRVIVIDGGAPGDIKQELRRLRAERHFELIECDSFLLPNMARNRALELTETRYLAYCDNDVVYHNGWLQALYDNIRRNDAVATAPITLVGPAESPIIHHAGGELSLRIDAEGRRRLRRVHRFGRTRLCDADAMGWSGVDVEHDYFEYRCVLLDAEALRDVGGHDERYVIHEHIDTSIRLRARGGRITFEPASRVMYTAFAPLRKSDWAYFLFRWDPERAELSNAVFSSNWDVFENSGYAEVHRNRAVATIMPETWKRLPSWRLRNVLLSGRLRLLNRTRRESEGRVNARRAPPPAPLALERAGILL